MTKNKALTQAINNISKRQKWIQVTLVQIYLELDQMAKREVNRAEVVVAMAQMVQEGSLKVETRNQRINEWGDRQEVAYYYLPLN